MMKWILSLLLLSCTALCTTPALAVQARFDSFYFYQDEADLVHKEIDREDLARFTRRVQTAVYKVMKDVKMKPAMGYLILAVRSDGEITTWADMEPELHPYYADQINEAIIKIPPFHVGTGIVVLAIKMSFDTPVFTKKAKPWAKDWDDVDKSKLNNPDDIEELVLKAWPE